jgi:endo-alpha-1,4-polygalactosaminidase (GH114 family)
MLVRRQTLAAILVAALLAVAAAVAASPRGASPAASPVAAPRAPRLASVRTFALAIGSGDLSGDLSARYRGYDLIVVDGQEATRGQLAALRAGGRIVIAYLNVGAIEPGRPWYPLVKRYRLDYWADFGEWYANVASRAYRQVIARRVAPSILAKGFDGLFLDNTDMIETHPRQAAGMRQLVRALAGRLHARHELLLAQNGEDVVGPLLPYLDGWNREDVTSTYDFATHGYVRQDPAHVAAAQAALRRIAARIGFVTATDYVASGDADATAQALRDACAVGAPDFVSDIGLTRVAQPPLLCS